MEREPHGRVVGISDMWGGRGSSSEKPVYRPLAKEIDCSEKLNECIALLATTAIYHSLRMAATGTSPIRVS
jgi:hypothetical protein